jgi:Bacterial Ig-like domain (group 3)
LKGPQSCSEQIVYIHQGVIAAAAVGAKESEMFGLWRRFRARSWRAAVAFGRGRALYLEHLEDRRLLSWGGGLGGGLANVTYHGGPLLQHVQVESVYYGTPWTTDAGLQQQISQVDGFLQYFTSSPYMSVLQQYNVSPGTFTGHDVVAQDPAGGQTIDDSQIRAALDSEIASSKVPTPSANQLYVFFTAPGVVVTQNGQSSAADFAGYHDVFTDSAGDTVYYAVVPYPNGGVSSQPLTTLQQDTLVLSHEVSEAVTDPDTQTGWFDAQQQEIGDLAQGTSGLLHGYVVQGVWSQADGRVVVPSDTSTPSLLVTGADVQATADQAFTGVVATITGADPQGKAGDFTATINWGDGSTSDGTVTADPKGGFDVTGTHTYANASQSWPEFLYPRFGFRGEQSYSITVTVNDTATNATGTGQSTASVVPAPPNISAQGQDIQATSGQSFSGVVATFTDANAQAQASNFTATVNWGDGTTSKATITADPKGGFDVNATHAYNTGNSGLEFWSGFGWGFPFWSGNQQFEVTVSISDTQSADSATAESLAMVAPAPPSLSVTANKISATVGQQFSGVVATFTDTDPKASAGTLTATIQWGDGTTTQGTVTVDPKGGFDVSGSHTYSSVGESDDGWETHGFWFGRHGRPHGFDDDGNVLSVTVVDTTTGDSATAQAPVSITPASTTATTTALSSTPNPSISGQTVTFTATVAATTPGTGTPTGTVSFVEGTTTLASSVTLNGSDQATFTTSSLAVGSHTITANYGGDSTFLASTGSDSASPQVVNQAAASTTTTTTVSSTPNPSVTGQTVTFTATVAATDGNGTPTGTVNFVEGTTTLASSVTLDGSDQATFTTSSLAVGSHTITANYGGDGNFLASTGDDSASPQVVNQAAASTTTTTTLSSTPNPSVSGQAVTFTATVAATDGTGTPTGTVNFLEGATTLASSVTLDGSDQATFTTSSLAVGNHTITASYSGDANFVASTGDDSASPQVVNQAAASTITTLSSTPNPSVTGQTVTFTATVAAADGTGTPTGTVNFVEGTTTLASSVTLDGSDQATFTTSSLAVGSHTITASYSGDGNFLTSTGDDSASPQVVNQAAASTITAISSTSNPSVTGQTVTFTATVAAADGTGTPTGTVNFVEGTTTLASSVTLNGSDQATFTTSSLAVGSHTIAANYSGDGNFLASTGDDSASPQVVNQAASSTTTTGSLGSIPLTLVRRHSRRTPTGLSFPFVGTGNSFSAFQFFRGDQSGSIVSRSAVAQSPASESLAPGRLDTFFASVAKSHTSGVSTGGGRVARQDWWERLF